jgi:pimeloyl-ACP methyl ester carboxylesterase
MKEEALLFGKNCSLVGVITDPSEIKKNQKSTGFIFLNSGATHRIGPYRLNVKMIRSLVPLGIVSFRFDFSGIGDSLQSSLEPNIKKRWVEETQEAMDMLEQRKGIKRFVLVGNCSGAMISFFTARLDSRVVGSVLINLRGHKTLLRYYLKLAFTNYKSWLRIIRGSANIRDLIKAAGRSTGRYNEQKSTDSYRSYNYMEDLRILIKGGTKLLIVYSEWDPGLPYFYAYFKNIIDTYQTNGNSQVKIIQGMDHNFQLVKAQNELIKIVHKWASRMK